MPHAGSVEGSVETVMEDLLVFAVALPTLAPALVHFSELLLGKQQVQQLVERAALGRLRPIHRRRVGLDAGDPLLDFPICAEQVDGVAMRLGHLLPVDAGDDSGRCLNACLRQLENSRRMRWVVAAHISHVEPCRPISHELHVLNLILTHRDDVRTVEENVCRHQDWISEQAEFRPQASSELVLVTMSALQMGEWHQRAEDPKQLEDLRDVALAEEAGPSRIEAQRNESDRSVACQLTSDTALAKRSEGVQVGCSARQVVSS